MSTQHPDLFAALAAPFQPHELKERTQSGKQLHYITARTVMNRLDNILGPENWWDDFTPSENSVLCRLTIRLPDGQTLTKGDAGGYAGMADSGDDDKSGYSDAFKRAAVKFGVARYLYRDGVPSFVEQGCLGQDTRESETPKPVKPPQRPAATNGHSKENVEWPKLHTNGTAVAVAPAPPPRESRDGSRPTTGKALFAWVRRQEERYQVGLLKYLNGWAKLQEFPGRMVEWDSVQVATALAEAERKLGQVESQEPE